MTRLRTAAVQVDEQGEPMLIIDVFDVDQYGRLLANVRVPETITMLARCTLAQECVAAGWAYTTPLHIVPHQVAEAFEHAKTNRVGLGDWKRRKGHSRRRPSADASIASSRTEKADRESFGCRLEFSK